MTPSIAVVTAVAGNYDSPRRDVFTLGVDYYFYADEASDHLVRSPWIGEPLYADEGHPRRVAKGPKVNPHAYPALSDHDVVIWVDGGCHIVSDAFVSEIVEALGDAPILLSPHFDDRHCAYGEATIRPPKYADEPLDEQVAHYRSVGFPENFGLYECGVMARNMKHPDAAPLGAAWEEEVARWSYQDQVSLPFVLWRLEIEPAVLPQTFRKYGWVKVNGHRSEL